MSRLLTTLLVLMATGCRCHSAPPITPEAAALFARADLPGAGASVVVDLDALRAQKWLAPSESSDTASAVGDALMYLLPSLAVELRDDEVGPLLARGAVMVGLLRAWAPKPQVQRVGVLLPWPAGGSLQDFPLDDAMTGLTVVLAVPTSKATNEELLRGVAALDRAGGEPMLEARGTDLCTPALDDRFEICVRAGNGYIALSSASGLQALVPAATATAADLHRGSLLHARVEVPLAGEATLSITGGEQVRMLAELKPSDPDTAATLEREARGFLDRIDRNRSATREVLTPVLARSQKSLSSDEQAPASLKKQAADMTADRLLDPSGTYQQLRNNISIRREGNWVRMDATLPPRLAQQMADGSAGLMGLLTAGALTGSVGPSLMRWRCQTRQLEVEPNLRAYIAEQRHYRTQNGQWATTFDDLPGFRPTVPSPYHYCLPGSCVECTRPGCWKPTAEENPCLRQQALPNLYDDEEGEESPPGCVFGTPGSRDGVDLWLVGPEGEPLQLQDGCD